MANAISMGFRSGQKARQGEELGAAGGDGLVGAGDAMGRQVVEDGDVTVLAGWGEDLADMDPEGIAIHRPVEHPGGGKPRQRKPAMKVMVFQRPNGTASRQRALTGARP